MPQNYEKLQKEIDQYQNQMKIILPIEEQIKKFKKSGMNLDEIKVSLGNDSTIFDYVPNVLYHGSPENLDIINSNESTQKGSYVYATDNPVHALFFSIFRNSGIARASICEYIDHNGNYQVKYKIDERTPHALDDIISDTNITIHICNGEQFFKPQGEAYISREWVSKNGQSIIPLDKIQINVKQFFDNLEKQGLVEYSRYNKSKDWKTVLDLLGQNYPFGLGTERANNIQEFDSIYDWFINDNFKEQFEFSQHFRTFIKKVMATDYKINHPGMSLEEENNYKLKYIRDTAHSFLSSHKDEYGNISFEVDMDKINNFLDQYHVNQEEKGRKL